MEELYLRDEVYRVVGAALEVYNVLGPGFLEAVYQEALGVELSMRGVSFLERRELHVRYKDRILTKRYVADLECFGGLLVEIKAIDHLTKCDEAQLVNYLKATGLEVGVLLNFGARQRLEWKRMVCSKVNSQARSTDGKPNALANPAFPGDRGPNANLRESRGPG